MAYDNGADDLSPRSKAFENGIKVDTIGEFTSGSGVTVSNNVVFSGTATFSGNPIGIPQVYSAAVAYDDTSVTAFTSEAGEEWIINRVWFVTGTSWDGTTAAVTVGDGNDADGYLAMANAQLLSTLDESGGVTGWTTGSYGLKDGSGGAYQFDGTGDERLIMRYVGAETIDVAVTAGDATQGSGTCYVMATRIA